MKTLSLTLGLLLSACAGGQNFDYEIIQDEVASAPMAVYEAPTCERVFTPNEAAYELTAAAVAIWSDATGCDIKIGEGGIPVNLVPQVIKPDGTHSYGVTYVGGDGTCYDIEISQESPHPYATTTHEIGHCLSGKAYGDPTAHSDTGVMASPIVTDDVDAASLEVICSGLPCSTELAPAPRPASGA